MVEKTLSRVFGKCSSLGGKRRALEHSVRAAFGLKGAFSSLLTARRWEQHGAALARREKVEPVSP